MRVVKEMNLEAVGPEVEGRLRSYVAGAIIPWINPDSPDQVPAAFACVHCELSHTALQALHADSSECLGCVCFLVWPCVSGRNLGVLTYATSQCCSST